MNRPTFNRYSTITEKLSSLQKSLITQQTQNLSLLGTYQTYATQEIISIPSQLHTSNVGTTQAFISSTTLTSPTQFSDTIILSSLNDVVSTPCMVGFVRNITVYVNYDKIYIIDDYPEQVYTIKGTTKTATLTYSHTEGTKHYYTQEGDYFNTSTYYQVPFAPLVYRGYGISLNGLEMTLSQPTQTFNGQGVKLYGNLLY